MSDRPTLYLKSTCPFCLKLRVFLTEAGLAERFDYVVFEDGDATHREMRAKMKAQGQEPGLPAADLGTGRLETGTDDLIARFAAEAGIDPARMALLDYYNRGVFKKYGEMFRELRERKAG